MKTSSLMIGFGSALLFACGGSTPAAQAPATPSTTGGEAKHEEATMAKAPTCHEIHEQCEPFENKGGAAQSCHDMTYKATEAECTAKKTECMAACKK